MNPLPCVEIEPRRAADATVIWLHGLGADGHDFAPIVPELRLPATFAVRFVFPHAPRIPVTINGGMIMPAWYDIRSLGGENRRDHDELLASAAAITALIEREVERGIDTRRIVLAGFSQGGAVALHTALSHAKPLAGLLVMSSYFATHHSIAVAAANRQLPILVQHGSQDPMVPEPMGRHTVAALGQLGLAPEYQTYPMAHAVCPQQIQAISLWLQQRLPPAYTN